jgi:uncharacterized FlgJ-related protein
MGFIGTRKQMIDKYGVFVKNITKGTGIFPATVFIQMITESSRFMTVNGKRVNMVGGSKLSREANNFFGIKGYKPAWKGEVYRINTTEQDKYGNEYTEYSSPFRKYATVEDSIRDYIKLITNSRYKSYGVTTAGSVKQQFEALKRAGYFTAQGYVNLAVQLNNELKDQIAAIPDTKLTDKRNLLPALALLLGLLYIGNEYELHKKIMKWI